MALRHLRSGESLDLGATPVALAAMPLQGERPERPLRAVPIGWELDVHGATGGALMLASGEVDPCVLAREGRPVRIGPGDHGLVEFGEVSVFFQQLNAAPRLARRRRWDHQLAWAFLFAITSTLGGLAILASIAPPSGLGRPVQLTPSAELFRMLRISPEASGAASHSASSAPDTGAAGRPRRRSGDDAARGESAIRSIRDALESDVGGDLRRALASIPGSATRAERPLAPAPAASAARDEPALAERPGQGLGPDEINQVVTTNLPSFRSCYDAARARRPKLAGVITVSFSVVPSGAVSGVAVATSSLRHKGVERCVLERFRTLAFPPSDRRTNASFAFVFSPNSGP